MISLRPHNMSDDRTAIEEWRLHVPYADGDAASAFVTCVGVAVGVAVNITALARLANVRLTHSKAD